MSAIAHLLHLTTPHHSNNFRARLLQPIGLLFLLTLFAFGQFLVNSYSRTYPGVLGYAANISPDEVIRLTNIKRTESGLSELHKNDSLIQAAHAKGEHMLEYDYWAHVAPDGTEPWHFFNLFSYKYRYAGENLARDFSNPQAAVDAWMASSSHRDNLMSPKYTEIGIAVVEGDLGGVDTTIIVQLFGTPMTAAAQNPVASPIPDVAAVVEEEQPVLIEQPEVQQAKLDLSNEAVVSPSHISPLDVSKTSSTIMIGLLFILLLVDVLVIYHKKMPRSGGRPIAHLSFLAIIFVIVLVAKSGNII